MAKNYLFLDFDGVIVGNDEYQNNIWVEPTFNKIKGLASTHEMIIFTHMDIAELARDAAAVTDAVEKNVDNFSRLAAFDKINSIINQKRKTQGENLKLMMTDEPFRKIRIGGMFEDVYRPLSEKFIEIYKNARVKFNEVDNDIKEIDKKLASSADRMQLERNKIKECLEKIKALGNQQTKEHQELEKLIANSTSNLTAIENEPEVKKLKEARAKLISLRNEIEHARQADCYSSEGFLQYKIDDLFSRVIDNIFQALLHQNDDRYAPNTDRLTMRKWASIISDITKQLNLDATLQEKIDKEITTLSEIEDKQDKANNLRRESLQRLLLLIKQTNNEKLYHITEIISLYANAETSEPKASFKKLGDLFNDYINYHSDIDYITNQRDYFEAIRNKAVDFKPEKYFMALHAFREIAKESKPGEIINIEFCDDREYNLDAMKAAHIYFMENMCDKPLTINLKTTLVKGRQTGIFSHQEYDASYKLPTQLITALNGSVQDKDVMEELNKHRLDFLLAYRKPESILINLLKQGHLKPLNELIGQSFSKQQTEALKDCLLSTDDSGNNLLHNAFAQLVGLSDTKVIEQQINFINQLLDTADKLGIKDKLLNSQNERSGYTALHMAAKANHLDAIKLLLNHGANPIIESKADGLTPPLVPMQLCGKDCVQATQEQAVQCLKVLADSNAGKEWFDRFYPDFSQLPDSERLYLLNIQTKINAGSREMDLQALIQILEKMPTINKKSGAIDKAKFTFLQQVLPNIDYYRAAHAFVDSPPQGLQDSTLKQLNSLFKSDQTKELMQIVHADPTNYEKNRTIVNVYFKACVLSQSTDLRKQQEGTTLLLSLRKTVIPIQWLHDRLLQTKTDHLGTDDAKFAFLNRFVPLLIDKYEVSLPDKAKSIFKRPSMTKEDCAEFRDIIGSCLDMESLVTAVMNVKGKTIKQDFADVCKKLCIDIDRYVKTDDKGIDLPI